MSFKFMAAVIVCSDFGAQENKVAISIVSPSICHEVMGGIIWISQVVDISPGNFDSSL